MFSQLRVIRLTCFILQCFKHLKTQVCQTPNIILFVSKLVSQLLLAHLTHADMRTHVGRNILGISRDCCTSFEDLTSQKVKSSMKYAPVPEDEEWRVSLIRKLLAVSLENEVDVPLSTQEIDDILNYACIT